ncbi:MAG: hypothetical protein PVH64_12685 [Bacillota bacterium]|jgi:hypothetical protein
MLDIILLISIFTGIILYEAPTLVRQKQWRELISFSIILVIGFVLCLFQIIGIKLPNPSRLIAALFNLQY